MHSARQWFPKVRTCFLCFLAVLEEGGVKMKLTVIDTPGFGDQINNENWCVFLQLLKLHASTS